MQDGQVVSHKGIDVSKHQGNIDWTKVAADGVEFAFIRVGLRGYGTEGKLVEDEYFEQNIKGALQAGIKVGVYFYSQAITDAELLEEANLVLEKIKPYNVELPIVYDVEKVSGGKGRANDLSVEDRTRLTALLQRTFVSIPCHRDVRGRRLPEIRCLHPASFSGKCGQFLSAEPLSVKRWAERDDHLYQQRQALPACRTM